MTAMSPIAQAQMKRLFRNSRTARYSVLLYFPALPVLLLATY